jgi:hypothetical protein
MGPEHDEADRNDDEQAADGRKDTWRRVWNASSASDEGHEVRDIVYAKTLFIGRPS